MNAGKNPKQAQDFLARDYQSFLKLIYDRLSREVPNWRERHAADVGVALAEVLAYAADYLCYYQDAVATEAYLTTARFRTSIRRHARLVDYSMSEGCNARAWIYVKVLGRPALIPKGTIFVTRIPGAALRVTPERIRGTSCEVFEAMEAIELYPAHNQMSIVPSVIGELELRSGATQALLAGHLQHLRGGDVLILEQRSLAGSVPVQTTGPMHAVRLNCMPRLLKHALHGDVTEIHWGAGDALPCEFVLAPKHITVARGNIVLADHGRTEKFTTTPHVPNKGRFEPGLDASPLTFAEPWRSERDFHRPAMDVITQDPTKAAAQISLTELPFPNATALDKSSIQVWKSARDLLSLDRGDRYFVVERDENRVTIRFGDGVNGRKPQPGSRFAGTYRVGNGSSGNVGPGAIAHVISENENVVELTNPLASLGGVDPEPLEAARLNAPQAFRFQKRCVTENDFAAFVMAHPVLGVRVAKAAAQRNWESSRRLVNVSVQPALWAAWHAEFTEALRAELQELAMLGDVVEVALAIELLPRVALRISTRGRAPKEETQAALGRKFREFFAPGQWSLGQPLHRSHLIARAMEVAGVRAAAVTEFRRETDPVESSALREVMVPLGNEIISHPSSLKFEIAEEPNA